ncbi:MAG: 50S ribosomal protein L15 [Candidatus Uhrbacteria bacterium]
MAELTLQNLKPAKGATKKRKRVGRGWGSGKGKYSGRGSKGQRSRSGGKSGLKKKGLRTVMLNIPKKRGFTSLQPKAEVINIGMLAKKFSDGAEISVKNLKEKGLISTVRNGVKILGNGQIDIKVTIKGCKVSATAKTKIEKAGGNVA